MYSCKMLILQEKKGGEKNQQKLITHYFSLYIIAEREKNVSFKWKVAFLKEMIACIFFQIFFKGRRGSKCELGQVTVLHLEHGINLTDLRQSGRVQNCKEKGG